MNYFFSKGVNILFDTLKAAKDQKGVLQCQVIS